MLSELDAGGRRDGKAVDLAQQKAGVGEPRAAVQPLAILPRVGRFVTGDSEIPFASVQATVNNAVLGKLAAKFVGMVAFHPGQIGVGRRLLVPLLVALNLLILPPFFGDVDLTVSIDLVAIFLGGSCD